MNGVALAAAAGVLLTATGTAGALAYAGLAAADRVWELRPAAMRLGGTPATSSGVGGAAPSRRRRRRGSRNRMWLEHASARGLRRALAPR